MLLLKSLIYSGVVVIVALFSFFLLPFFSFHKERLESSKRYQSIACACLYAMTLCYSQYRQRQRTILSRRILIVAGHGRRAAECAVRVTPFFPHKRVIDLYLAINSIPI